MVDIVIIWSGSGTKEVGKCKETGKILVRVNKNYFRPAEVDLLVGDASKAKELLNWSPKISLDRLIQEMVEFDLKILKKK